MKKKGLIISTIVMVVVLVASLSTATYAWFSSTAKATVSNISVSTVAAQGLQVAVKGDGDNNYFYGDLTFENNVLGSLSPGWGSDVNFAAITQGDAAQLGKLDSAVTRVKGSGTLTDYSGGALTNMVYLIKNKADITEANGYLDAQSHFTQKAVDELYTVGTNVASGNSELQQVTLGGEVNSDNAVKYYTADTTFKADDYLLPIGYNDENGVKVPYGYVKAVANTNYLDLPISVRPTVDMPYILCSLTLTPKQGGMSESIWNNYKPGMAAATFIEIKENKADGAQSVILEPYNTTTLTATNAANKSDTAFVFKFVVAYNNNASAGADAAAVNAARAAITGGSAIDYSYRIWIEGTDAECRDITAGSMFDIGIDYSYVQEDMSNADDSLLKTAQPNVDKGWNAVPANGVPMAALTGISGIVKYKGEKDAAQYDYYVLSISKNFAV